MGGQVRGVLAVLLVTAAALAAGCSGDDATGTVPSSGATDATTDPAATPVPTPAATPATATAASPTVVTAPAPSATDSTTTVVVPPDGPDCAAREGAVVTPVPDVEVAPVEVPAVTLPGVLIDGRQVGGGTLAGFTIPGQTVDGGCIIEYDAPGGCLGAVEISAATIGPGAIPSAAVEPLTLPGGQVIDGVTLPGVSVPAVVAPAVRTDPVCQVDEVDEGGEVPTVSRAGVVRRGIARDGVVRPGDTRPERCVGDVCVPAVRIDAVRLDAVRLPDVDVEPARLQRRRLRDDVDVIDGDGDGTTSYITPGDVLFDSDQAVIRPDADAALGEIAALLAAAPDATVRVDGHTDDLADDAHNLDLSVRRAQAVADWFTARAGVDPARIVVAGLGETTPAYPNDTDEHRQLNRRVVITF